MRTGVAICQTVAQRHVGWNQPSPARLAATGSLPIAAKRKISLYFQFDMNNI
jgi:hypothetical protein